MLVPAATRAALVVLGWLAQAEPAPSADPELPQPLVSAADPQPARSPSAQGPEEPPPHAPLRSIAVHGRFAYRPNDTGSGVPAGGFSLGATFERRYAQLGGTFGFGAGLDFFFDRFASDEKMMTSGTQVALYTRELMQTSFVALQTVAIEHLPVRPWIAAGAGIAVGSVASGASVRPVARGAAGVELGLSRSTALVVRADVTHPLTDAGAYGDILDVGLGICERF
jgi:hypothetical protein